MPPEHRAPGPAPRALAIRRPAFRSLIFFSWHDIFFMVQSASQDTNRRKLDNNAPVGAAGHLGWVRTQRQEGGSMTRDEGALRADIVAKARWMNAAGPNQGTSANIPPRYKDVLLITPSA